MPKDLSKTSDGSYKTTCQEELKKLANTLLIGTNGQDARELEIVFSTVDRRSDISKRAEYIESVLKRTPNLTTLTLNYVGWLYKSDDPIGDKLLDTMCKLVKLQHFKNKRTQDKHTHFGRYELMKLASSLPHLRTIHLGADMYSSRSRDCDGLLPASCALESVIFENCTSDLEELIPMFAGSANSLRAIEVQGGGDPDPLLRLVLPSIRSIKLGGSSGPSPEFIVHELFAAPYLKYIRTSGQYVSEKKIREALTKALNREGSFPSLKWLMYPGSEKNVPARKGKRGQPAHNGYSGITGLLSAAARRHVEATELSGPNLKYEIERVREPPTYVGGRSRGWRRW